MKKRFYVHFEEGFNLGFLLEVRAFNQKGAHKAVKSMLKNNPNKALESYKIYTSKSVVKLANEHVLALTKEQRKKEIYETYLMVWKSTRDLSAETLLKNVKQQLSVMDVEALTLLRNDVLGNEYDVAEFEVNNEANKKLSAAEAMLDVVRAIEYELQLAKANLFKLNDLSNQDEIRAALEQYLLLVARIKEVKKLIKGKEYDWLLERYFEFL